jgi:hypothetical protein
VFSSASSKRFDRCGGEGRMQELSSNGDVKASCAEAGMDRETIGVGRPQRDFRAIAAFGCVAMLGVVVIGAGVLMKPPAASAVPSFARQTGQPLLPATPLFPS